LDNEKAICPDEYDVKFCLVRDKIVDGPHIGKDM